ncbi:MAG TPA: hypothetical protein PKM21_06870 [Anaerolineales bacterium]|nr:hypothetical protein [Anaerolineales bacterium]
MEMSWLYLVLCVGAVICAYRAMRTTRILVATLYLACISAIVSIMLYMLKAYQVAAIELSVGAGLVTVLLVYAISVIGDDAYDPASIIPKPLAIVVTLAAALLMGVLALPLVGLSGGGDAATAIVSMRSVLWQQRALDVWIQMVLIFSGVMGMLGLLAEGKSRQRSGLHTLTEIKGQVPQSQEYVQANQTSLAEKTAPQASPEGKA